MNRIFFKFRIIFSRKNKMKKIENAYMFDFEVFFY